MPSRFMLLYGADDDKLRGQGNINEHPDKFEGEEHEISVANLRKGLKLLGYNVEKDGPFDDTVYHAFLRYHWRHGRVRLGGVYEEDDDVEKPLSEVADKYGMFTWKIFQDKYNGEVDHDRITDELNPEYGDELLTAKGVDPQGYRPGVAYHYVWVPFCMTVDMGKDYPENGDVPYEIYDRQTRTLLGEGTIRKPYKIERILPNSEDAAVIVNGTMVVAGTRHVTKIYWSYGENHELVRNTSKYYADINLHVETNNYNDGDKVVVTIKNDDERPLFGDIYKLDIIGTVFDNKAVIDNVFKEYIQG